MMQVTEDRPAILPGVSKQGERSYEIDVIRALAISLVVVFHYTVTWTQNSPSRFHVAGGWVGVELFFIVSGYCIAETIGRCRTVALFLVRRISRLYPAFAVVVILLAAIRNADPAVLAGNLLFAWDAGLPMLDPVFWSLLVEMKFYVLFAALRFAFPASSEITFAKLAIGLCAAWMLLTVINISHPLPAAATYVKAILSRIFVAPFLPFFAVGILASYYLRNGRGSIPASLQVATLLTTLLSITVLSMVLTSPHENTTASVAIFAIGLLLFLAAIAGVRFPYSTAIHKIGLLSYVIYLVHNELGHVIGIAMPNVLQLSPLFSIALQISIVILVSWIVSVACEWRFRSRATAVLSVIFRFMGLDRLQYDKA